jgi:hypothetical protein
VGLAAVAQDLDDPGTEIDVFADGPAHFVVAVGEEVFGIVQRTSIRRDIPELAPKWPDDSSSEEESRPGYQIEPDRFFQVAVGIFSSVADVANRREPRFEHLARVVSAEQRAEGGGPLDGVDPEVAEIPFGVDIGAEMRMGIEKAREDDRAGEIDDGGAGGDGDLFPDGLDGLVLDQDDLIADGDAAVGIDQCPCLDGDRLAAKCREGKDQHRQENRRDSRGHCKHLTRVGLPRPSARVAGRSPRQTVAQWRWSTPSRLRCESARPSPPDAEQPGLRGPHQRRSLIVGQPSVDQRRRRAAIDGLDGLCPLPRRVHRKVAPDVGDGVRHLGWRPQDVRVVPVRKDRPAPTQ